MGRTTMELLAKGEVLEKKKKVVQELADPFVFFGLQ